MQFYDEAGAVTVDWVVLTAGLAGLGLATMSVVSSGVQDVSEDVEAHLKRDNLISTGFVTATEYVNAALDMVTFGDATYDAETGIYTLTEDVGGQAGHIHTDAQFDLAEDFNFSFSAYFGADDGADGITWIMHSNENFATGEQSPAGAWQVDNSIHIEFDTYFNGEQWEGGNTSWSDHSQIYSQYEQDGTMVNPMATSGAALSPLENDTWYDVSVDWDSAASELSYSLDGQVIESVTFDAGDADGDGFSAESMSTVLGGTDQVYFSMFGRTGGSYSLQEVQDISVTGQSNG